MVVPLATILLFGVFVGAGLTYRTRPDVHKRFMLLATIAMLPPAIGRGMGQLFGATQPGIFFGAIVFFVLAIVIYDRRKLPSGPVEFEVRERKSRAERITPGHGDPILATSHLAARTRCITCIA